jgi:hypothetical protein
MCKVTEDNTKYMPNTSTASSIEYYVNKVSSRCNAIYKHSSISFIKETKILKENSFSNGFKATFYQTTLLLNYYLISLIPYLFLNY